ncbi:hypothetical protein BBJ28_00008036 [Nothophytophthora sp. Chile5]|nr:hypothetical protein BBJ28_00008036 [Nothophytophthora sp. Chile5]
MAALPELPEPEEAQALLAEVLEFIDACDVDDNPTESVCLSPRRNLAGVEGPASVENALAVGNSSAKRVRDTRVSDRRRRAKRKAEREFLRQEAGCYEEQLAVLKQSQRVPRDCEVYWFEAATNEAAKRRKTEELNGELKTLVSEYVKMKEAMRGLLGKTPPLLAVSILELCRTMGEDRSLNFVRGTCTIQRIQATSDCSLPSPTNKLLRPSQTELKDLIPLLFASTDAVFAGAFAPDDLRAESISSSMRINQQDPIVGLCVELSATTPLPCSIEDVNGILWGMLSGKEWFDKQKLVNYEVCIRSSSCTYTLAMELTQRSMELGYTIGYRGHSKTTVHSGVSLIKRREEENRIVMVSATQASDACGHPCFRQRSWVMISRSSKNPLQASVVRIFCQLSAEPIGATCGQQPPMKESQRVILRSVSQQIKAKLGRHCTESDFRCTQSISRDKTPQPAMSFLLTDVDDQVAVQEALAFIDACDSTTDSRDAFQDCEASPETNNSSRKDHNGTTRRERNRVHDVRRRLRKKGEMFELRKQAEELARRLELLQRRPVRSTREDAADSDEGSETSGDSPMQLLPCSTEWLSTKRRKGTASLHFEGSWEAAAAIRRQARMEAELLNMKLKKALASEMKVSRSLRLLLERRPSMRAIGIDQYTDSLSIRSRSLPVAHCSPSSLQDDPAAVMQDLKEMMKQLHAKACLTLVPDPVVSYTFNLRIDPALGPVSELESTTLAASDLQRAKQYIGLNTHRITGDGECESRATVEVGTPDKSEILDRVSSMRQFDEESRVIVTWASLTFHPSGALCFRERGWMIAVRSPSNPLHDTIIHTHYNLTAEKALGCATVDGEDIDQAMEQLYTDVISMAPPTPALSYNYNVSFDPVHGPVSEVTSTTPLYWDLNRTKQFLGPNFLKQKMSGSLKLKEVRTTDGGRIENQFTVEVGKPGTSTMLDRMGSMSRHEEEDRVLVTWFALTFHRKGVLCFRERGWMVATRSLSNPTTESVVQTHYTLEAEKAADCTVVDGEDVDRVRDRVLGALADIMKTKHKRIQQSMLAETGRPDLISLVSH